MNPNSQRRALFFLLAVALVACVAGIHAQIVGAYPFRAAYFDRIMTRPEHVDPHGKGLVLFPLVGRETVVPLPPSLPGDFLPLASSPDGRAVIGKHAFPNSWTGLIRLDLMPARVSLVTGSDSFGILTFTFSRRDGVLFVWGWRKDHDDLCGVFELNTSDGTVRPLGPQPDRRCQSFMPGGGQRENVPKRSHLINPVDGTVVTLDEGLSGATWSPDGKWIAAVMQRANSTRSVVIDANDFSKRRDLGKNDESSLLWSPDSIYLLLSHADWRCGPYFDDLEAIEVSSGKRRPIPGSHCRIGTGAVGWLDNRVIEQ
jgi:hypothetical protein